MASPVGNTSFRLALRFPLTVAHLPPASCLLLTPTPGQEESLSGGLTGGQGQGAQRTPLFFLLALLGHRKNTLYAPPPTKLDYKQPRGGAAGGASLIVAHT